MSERSDLWDELRRAMTEVGAGTGTVAKRIDTATVLANGGIYIGGGTLLLILIFLLAWAIPRR